MTAMDDGMDQATTGSTDEMIDGANDEARDETADETAAEAMEEARAAASGPARSMLERAFSRFGGRAVNEAVFGAPIERGGRTVIPVARVMAGFGGGEGTDRTEGAGGAGAGGGMIGQPLGYIEMGPDGVAYRPISQPPNPVLFLLAAGITGAIVLRAIRRLVRG